MQGPWMPLVCPSMIGEVEIAGPTDHLRDLLRLRIGDVVMVMVPLRLAPPHKTVTGGA